MYNFINNMNTNKRITRGHIKINNLNRGTPPPSIQEAKTISSICV